MRLSILMSFLICWGAANSQLPIWSGISTKPNGMVFYDVEKVEDRTARIYEYTIAPDSADCLMLDFSLALSPGDKDFIELWEDQSDGKRIAAFGGADKSQLFQIEASSVKLRFRRDAYGLGSAWTLKWRSQNGCISGGAQIDDCPEIQEVCGPEFIEDFRYFEKLEVAQGSNYEAPQAWYRFLAAQDGDLMFRIQPRNAFADFDWKLYRLPADSTQRCPDALSDNFLVATNEAAGKGPRGTTGIDRSGQRLRSSSTGNPFCRRVPAQKGDQFYLHVLHYGDRNEGFRLKFNEVVLACQNPERDFLPLGHKPPLSRPVVPARNQFSRYSRILRLDLQEKANRPLQNCKLEQLDLNQGRVHKKMDENWRPAGQGLPGILLTGLKYGSFPAYSAHDHATPVSYGDLIRMAGKWNGTQKPLPWDCTPDALWECNKVVEMIVDESFDRNAGRSRQQIRMFRLVWSPDDESLPETNIALFHYEDILPFLEKVEIANPHNETVQMSIASYLASQGFSSVTVEQRNKPNRRPQDSQFEDASAIEFESHRWDY